MSLANSDFIVSEEMLLSQNIPEILNASPDLEYLFKLISETPADTQPTQGIAPDSLSSHVSDPLNSPPQIAATFDDITRLCIVCSALASIPLPTPPPQAITSPPCNWYRIPQEAYSHGKRQWDFVPLQCISFEVDGFPGMNMRDAFQKRFTDLVGRDDQVLQDSPAAVSCRLSVSLSRGLRPQMRANPISSSLDTHPTVQFRYERLFGCIITH